MPLLLLRFRYYSPIDSCSGSAPGDQCSPDYYLSLHDPFPADRSGCSGQLHRHGTGVRRSSRAYAERHLAGFDDALQGAAGERQPISVNGEADLRFGTGGQPNPSESDQLGDWASDAGDRVGDVELYDLVAVRSPSLETVTMTSMLPAVSTSAALALRST